MPRRPEPRYIPAWKAPNGDRLIFLSAYQLFMAEDDAIRYQANYMTFFFKAGGLSPAGVMVLRPDETGQVTVPHVVVPWTHGLGGAAIVSGPTFDAAQVESKGPSVVLG